MKRKLCIVCLIFMIGIPILLTRVSKYDRIPHSRPIKIVLKKGISEQIKRKNRLRQIRAEKIYLYNTLPEIRRAKVIAHRGQGFGGQENSLGALEDSMKAKVDYAEIDVQETRDGKVVLMHDENLKRLTGLSADVNHLTYKQIERLNIAPPLHRNDVVRIPTLDRVIKKCNNRLNLIIEIKPYGNTEDLTNKVVKIIEDNNYVNQCKIHSVSYGILLQVKRLNPNIQTGIIVCGRTSGLCSMNVDFYSIEDDVLNKNLVNDIHAVNRKVYAWTVDGKAGVNNMLGLDVDGIISNKPRLLMNIKKKKVIHKI
ncbi:MULTISPECIES: glycerophosphodiester phosphodiesterase family protein [Clostridium]|uniref:glycerophosphodiester phosphodiesterase family protein n=1 Tax=Clostridium TaxID=1485 RepID=UPI000825CE83|nr:MULTISPECIES: glycerophosphodiester phosphodiesterase family protein [Clostridium]PJI10522.1 glycerophosphodiester phosphodiesterase [Clostridium sp. CT7]